MRHDSLGLFWLDEPPPPKQEKVKREPPEPVWLEPDYLPNLEEATTETFDLLTDNELIEAQRRGDVLVFDIECYENYFLCAFQSLRTNKVIYFEKYEGVDLHVSKFEWVLKNFTVVGFNSRGYDIPIATLAIRGCTNEELKQATTCIIELNMRTREVLDTFNAAGLKGLDHIDLIEVAPLRASLKIYGGRLHTRRMRDLPFHPDSLLSEPQRLITRWYCVNDLAQTRELYESLKPQLELRRTMSLEYQLDLRSKSDAQIAEAVLSKRLREVKGVWRIQAPFIEPGTTYYYQVPYFLRYQTPLMQHALAIVANAKFIVSPYGNVGMPQELKDLQLAIGGSVYRMGIGGLHSSEQSTSHQADESTLLVDRDVTSYYPAIILNLGLYPEHLGPDFLHVYKSIVDLRLSAKRRGDKVTSDSLKITINGSFGKLGNMHSMLYSPHLLIQVTVTGQLALLMLIEALELQGIQVVSANTDGLVIKCPTHLTEQMDAIVGWWEKATGFETEATSYKALYSRDVNNYIAVTADGALKSKGAYATPGLQKNPVNEICVEAVKEFLLQGTPIGHTVRACSDITKFVNVRNVRGGAVKDGEYLGRAIRWYYAKDVEGEIVYAASGNKVPRSEGAKPLMRLSDEFPTDIDYDWYVAEAYKILTEIGCNSE